MTVGERVHFQRRKGGRIMSGTIREVRSDYLVVLSGGKFYTVRREALR